MRMQKRTGWPLAFLLGLFQAGPVIAADYKVSDYLPLAVGNSWTYSHDYYDVYNPDESQWTAFTSQEFPQFTISVLNTEVIDKKTYFVISAMPDKWPPPPPHFIAGKKLRWDGSRLMERTEAGERSLFHFFDGPNAGGYAVATDEKDTKVTVMAGDDSVPWLPRRDDVPWHTFEFHGSFEGDRWYRFILGYGLHKCRWTIFGEDHPVFTNRLELIRAVIGGRTLEAVSPLTSTATLSSSWGQVKQEAR